MSTRDIFEKIRPIWLERVASQLSIVEKVQESFAEQLAQLYEALVNAVVEGSSKQLEPILMGWINSRTELDYNPAENSVYSILSQMMVITCDVANEKLNAADALAVISQAIPIYTFALELSATNEAKLDLRIP